jgi:phthiodiolone/phenolphthiodiolone dimycocerosates ketoreductase
MTTAQPLRVGLRVPPLPPSEALTRFVGRSVEGGFNSLWWPDHLMGFSTPGLWAIDPPSVQSLNVYADPFVAITSCADVLGSVDVGTCVTDAIRRSPATLAQTTLSVDWAVAGRMILGLGAGEAANYRPYGIDIESPAERLDTAARQIRELFDSPGPNDDGAILSLRARDADNPPQLWLATHGPRGQRLTGQVADGWMPQNIDLRSWEAGREVVQTAARESGRDVDDIELALSVDVVVADTRAEAVALLAHPVIRSSCLTLPPSEFARYGVSHPLGRSAFYTLIPTRDKGELLAAAMKVPDAMVADFVIHGDVDDVVTAIRSYSGLQHVRLSDLGSATRQIKGGLKRLLAISSALQGA